jgi:Arc/MetJ-type ribon-helix-helix transcriptional regulator
MKKKEEKKTVFLPGELYSKIEERVNATDFGLVDEYMEFVVAEVVEEEEERAFREEEVKEVKKRLKDLGYLE